MPFAIPLLIIAALCVGIYLPFAISGGYAIGWITVYSVIVSILIRSIIRCSQSWLWILALPLLVALPFFLTYYLGEYYDVPAYTVTALSLDDKLHLYDVLLPRLLSMRQETEWDFATRLMAVLTVTSTTLLLLVTAIAGSQLIGLISHKIGTPTSTSFIWYSSTLPDIFGVTIVLGQFAMLGMVNGFIAPDALGFLDRLVQTPQPAPVIIVVVSLWTTTAIYMGAMALWGITRSSRSIFNSLKN